MSDTAAPAATPPLTTAPPPLPPAPPKRRGKLFFIVVGHDAPGKWRRISMATSMLSLLVIWLFFVLNRGWVPAQGTDADIIQYTNWFLQFLLAEQILILVLTSSTGRRGEVWLNLIVALLPALLILYLLGLHWGNYETMPLTQLRLAKSVALISWMTFLIGIGVALLGQSRTAQFQGG